MLNRTIVIHDCVRENKIIGEYEIIALEGTSSLKVKDYPTLVTFSRISDFNKFKEEKVAYIHPGEVYAYLKPL